MLATEAEAEAEGEADARPKNNPDNVSEAEPRSEEALRKIAKVEKGLRGKRTTQKTAKFGITNAKVISGYRKRMDFGMGFVVELANEAKSGSARGSRGS